MEIGTKVEIIDDFNGHNRHVCSGVVEKITPTQVYVRNQHGNLSKFWSKNLRQVGYAWPTCTYVVRVTA